MDKMKFADFLTQTIYFAIKAARGTYRSKYVVLKLVDKSDLPGAMLEPATGTYPVALVGPMGSIDYFDLDGSVLSSSLIPFGIDAADRLDRLAAEFRPAYQTAADLLKQIHHLRADQHFRALYEIEKNKSPYPWFLPTAANVEQLARLWFSGQPADARRDPMFKTLAGFFFAAWNQFQSENKIPWAAGIVSSTIDTGGVITDRLENTKYSDGFCLVHIDAQRTANNSGAPAYIVLDRVADTFEVFTTPGNGTQFIPICTVFPDRNVAGDATAGQVFSNQIENFGRDAGRSDIVDAHAFAFAAVANKHRLCFLCGKVIADEIGKTVFGITPGAADGFLYQSNGHQLAFCSGACRTAFGKGIEVAERALPDTVAGPGNVPAAVSRKTVPVIVLSDKTEDADDDRSKISGVTEFCDHLLRALDDARKDADSFGRPFDVCFMLDTLSGVHEYSHAEQDEPVPNGYYVATVYPTDSAQPAGFLQVGHDSEKFVILNLDRDRNGIGHICFSAEQARSLAASLDNAAAELEGVKPYRVGLDEVRAEMEKEFAPAPVTVGIEKFEELELRFIDAANLLMRAGAIFKSEVPFNDDMGYRWLADYEDLAAGLPAAPLDIVVFCPKCGVQHIDAPEPDKCETCGMSDDHGGADHTFKAWLNPPHKTHRCHNCNHKFRPANVPTNGVATLPGLTKVNSQTPNVPGIPADAPPNWQIPLQMTSFCAHCERPISTSPVWVSFPAAGHEPGQLLTAYCSAECDARAADRDAAEAPEPGNYFINLAKHGAICHVRVSGGDRIRLSIEPERVKDRSPETEALSRVFLAELPEDYRIALNLLERATSLFENGAPDDRWFREYYGLTGDFAFVTSEGWELGGAREHYIGDIIEFVNPPERLDCLNGGAVETKSFVVGAPGTVGIEFCSVECRDNWNSRKPDGEKCETLPVPHPFDAMPASGIDTGDDADPKPVQWSEDYAGPDRRIAPGPYIEGIGPRRKDDGF